MSQLALMMIAAVVVAAGSTALLPATQLRTPTDWQWRTVSGRENGRPDPRSVVAVEQRAA